MYPEEPSEPTAGWVPVRDPAVDRLVARAASLMAELSEVILHIESILVAPPSDRRADLPPEPAELEAAPNPGAAAAARAALTPREGEILGLLCRGMSNRRIARTLRISEPTVKNHLHAVFVKLGVADRTEAIVKALSFQGPAPDFPRDRRASSAQVEDLGQRLAQPLGQSLGVGDGGGVHRQPDRGAFGQRDEQPHRGAAGSGAETVHVLEPRA